MNKIIIVGTAGCGKTTLGYKLKNLIKLTYYDLDDYYWLSNWQAQDESKFLEIIEEITSKDRWIAAGNFTQVRDMIWHKSDMIIWLDYSFTRCLYQVFIRCIKRIIFKQKCCGENYENFKKSFFSKDSILLYVIRTFYSRRKLYRQLLSGLFEKKNKLIFKNPRQVDEWLKSQIFSPSH